MNKICHIFFIYFILSPFLCFGQNSIVQGMLDDNIKISQKHGTNNLLKNYLSFIDSDVDTIYAILFRPMSCPRCESAIPFFTNSLRKINHTSKTLLITVYENSIAANSYLNRKNYHADYLLLDTAQQYKQIFSLNTDGIYGLYILKINRKEGRLIIGGEVNTVSQAFIKEILNYDSIIPCYTFEALEEKYIKKDTNYRNSFPQLTYDIYKVIPDSLHPISGVYNFPMIKNDILLYTDELANEGYHFNINHSNKTIKFAKSIRVDSIERDMFIDIPFQEYQIRKKAGIIHYIALNINLLNKKQIGLSYSLPKLFMESPDNVAYYNQPTIITRNIKNVLKSKMITLDFDLFNERYMYSHTTFFPLNKQSIILGCKKTTWPIEFDKKEYEGKIELDPFMNDFYDHQNPYLAIFNLKTGKLVKRFGNLDISQRLSRTGYYYSNPIVNTYKKKIVYGNGFTGKLYIAKRNNPSKIEKELIVFNINIKAFPQLNDSLFYTLQHAKAYNPFFQKCIEVILLIGKNVHCLIRNGLPNSRNRQKDIYEYICINYETGKIINDFILNKEYDDEHILSYGLAKKNKKVYPYYFSNRNNTFSIKYISCKIDISTP